MNNKYMSWITKTFENPEELMIALLKGEKWKYNGAVFSYRDFKFYIGIMPINSLQSMEILCDNKTLWTKVEEKTELDLMEEKYKLGYTPVWRATKADNYFIPIKDVVKNVVNMEEQKITWVAEKHKDILTAYLADNSVEIEIRDPKKDVWFPLQDIVTKTFVEAYTEKMDYRLKPKKKTISLAMFTCYDSDRKIWEDITICENLDEYKIKLFGAYFINHHEIPNTRYEQEIDE